MPTAARKQLASRLQSLTQLADTPGLCRCSHPQLSGCAHLTLCHSSHASQVTCLLPHHCSVRARQHVSGDLDVRHHCLCNSWLRWLPRTAQSSR